MSEVIKHDGGIFLARAPGQVADNGTPSGASVIRGAKSGNKRFDPKTGKFAPASGGKVDPVAAAAQNPIVVNRSGIPQGVAQEEWERRLDMVRDAAREFDQMSEGDAQEFLKGRVNDISKVDVAAFLVDVRAQRVDDMTDAIDQQLRKSGSLTRARRTVKLAAPRGWLKRAFGSLEDDEVVRMFGRLENRGHSREELTQKLIGRINDEARQKTLKLRLGVSDDDNQD